MAKTVLSKVKLFDSELGKILVRVETDKTGKPVLAIYFQRQGVGICCTSTLFDKGKFNAANRCFDETDKKTATQIVKRFIEQ